MASNKTCYYEVLDVSRSASAREIAAAYRKLAIKYHPDSNPGDADATARFKSAAEAYEVLSDEQKRARYDQYGHAGVDGSTQFGQAEDIFEAFGDIFGGGLFGDIFGGGGGGGGRRRRVHRGADIRVDVELQLEEAARGVTKTIEFSRHERCETCEGTRAKPGSSPRPCRQCGGRGQVVRSAGILTMKTTCPSCQGQGMEISDPCDACRGRGFVPTQTSRDVRIPGGIEDGTYLNVRGEGEPSPDGGPSGDLHCYITVLQHRLFGRDGQDLLLPLPISYSQAALGATIEVPTLSGPAELQVPAGTQSGEILRLRGRGLPDWRDAAAARKGDLLVRTYIETPKKLNARQRELLRELAELEHVHVTPERKSFLEKLADYFTGHSADEEE